MELNTKSCHPTQLENFILTSSQNSKPGSMGNLPYDAHAASVVLCISNFNQLIFIN